jgi:hypothetical protein
VIDDQSDPGSWGAALAMKADMVNQPPHYQTGGIEAIDYIEAKLSREEFAGYCRGNALKYLSRAGHKDATAQEVGKAIWYLERWKGSLARTDKPTQSYAPQSGAPSPAGRSGYRNEWDAPLRSTD